MSKFRFVLPIKPVSVNSLYSYRKGATKPWLSPEGRDFKLKAHEHLMQQWAGKPTLKGQVIAELNFHYKKRKGREPDTDNPVKITLDALTGVVIEDDVQVKKVTAEKFVNETEDKIEITVIPIMPTQEEMKKMDHPTKKRKAEEPTNNGIVPPYILKKVKIEDVANTFALDDPVLISPLKKPKFSDPDWKDPRQPFWENREPEIRKTAEEWYREDKEWDILDPDGWPRADPNVEKMWWEDLITKKEYIERRNKCTVASYMSYGHKSAFNKTKPKFNEPGWKDPRQPFWENKEPKWLTELNKMSEAEIDKMVKDNPVKLDEEDEDIDKIAEESHRLLMGNNPIAVYCPIDE